MARAVTGQALYHAQLGSKHINAKPLKGFHGAAVMEIVADAEGDAYRAAYTVQFADVIYVLHCFQKKSKRGAKTPQHHIEMIRRRLKMAQENHARTRKETAN
ncbi:MAG: type II toxin-antitoxin system RelE/ParE family toxin [Candidatus Binataceae bacterium]